MSMTYTSNATNMTVFISIPDGPRIRGRVKEIKGVHTFAKQVHPGRRHQWHEMLHYGQPGTGFAHCACGATGVPYNPPDRDS